MAAALFHIRLVQDRPVRRQVVLKGWRRGFWPCWVSSSPPALSHRDGVDIEALPWRRHMYVLYVTSFLILVRSMFRLVEYVQGEDGYLLSREVFLYAFDAALMLVVMGLFNVVHPSQVTRLYGERVGCADGVELGRAGTEERLVV